MPKIKDIPKVERPREKLLKKGVNALSKTDLLAILLGSGIKGTNVQVLAKTIISKFNQDFLNITIDDLLTVKGIGQAKASQIYSAVALIKRFYQEQHNTDLIVSNIQNVLTLAFDIRNKKKEHLICLHLDSRNALIKKETLSIGLLDKSLIHPREIFSSALENKAANIILIHNHPSGDPTPSKQDEQIAKKISGAGQIMGIPLLDFVIIAKDGHHSFYQQLSHGKQDEYVAEGFQTGLFDMLEDETPVYENNQPKFTFIDLFAGIGGFHLAASNLGGKCVFASEFDDSARQTYQTNFLKHNKDLFYSGNFAGDITKVDEKDIPDFDFLFAGFPCQPFSQAGFKKGFNETRGTLFFDIASIIREKQPKAFFLENVRGLLKHDDEKTFKTIKKILKKLGYSFFYKIVKASDFGLPQHRPRLFMVGFKDKSIDFKFPEAIKLTMTMADIWNGKCPKEIGYTLRVGGRGSSIDDRRNWDAYLVDGEIKQLGVKEGKKMQGLPQDFLFPVSSTQAMKQLGNSVAVPAIKAVIKQMGKYIEGKI